MRTRPHTTYVICLLLGFAVGAALTAVAHRRPRQVRPREGVIDIPVCSAPGEIWEAAQVWKTPSATVVAQKSADGSMGVSYFLDIGMEAADREALRARFHQRLLDAGWIEQPHEDGEHQRLYVSGGRQLSVGYDVGSHPTSLILRYSESERPQAGLHRGR